MNKKKYYCRGASIVSVMIGMVLLSLSVTGALGLMGKSMHAQQKLNTGNLVDQVQRISEIMTSHLNRGGGKTPSVEQKGIQLCSLLDKETRCSGYNLDSRNFCVSVPSRVSQGGQQTINMTGFRLFNGVLSQRDSANEDMVAFSHNKFCQNHAEWLDLNNVQDFEFTKIRLCRFQANTVHEVTKNYEKNCTSVIQDEPKSNMYWVALFNAKIGKSQTKDLYEEVRIIHLLNNTRVGIGS